LDGRTAEGLIVERTTRDTESSLDLTLAQGLPKGDKLDSIIRMATELGASRVVPLICRRSVARSNPGSRPERLARWERIAREAAMQSGRGTIPEIRPPVALSAWIGESRPPGLLLCLWEGEPQPLDAVLPGEPPDRAVLVVGPEGGLAVDEVEALRSAGAIVG